MIYINTHLEDFIYSLYNSLGVTKPEQLDMFQIASRLDVEISFRKTVFRFDKEIVLSPGTRSEEWMDFGHEICHYLRHCGSQLKMHQLFINLQEYQANYFAYHFCVPTFMLEKLKHITVYEIMNQFNVDYEFACGRLEMHENKVYAGVYYRWV